MSWYDKARAIDIERVTEAVQSQMQDLANPGFCLDCGDDADGCEPDAEHYPCESCGRHSVFGAEQVLLMHSGAL